MRRSVTRACAAVLAIGAAAILAGSLGSAHAASGRQAIANTRPAWLNHATNKGHAAPGAPVNARIYFAPNGGMAKLKQFAVAVSTPGDKLFGHFLTRSQYFQRFGTTSSAVSAVKSWLTGAGLKVTGVEAHNRYVTVSRHRARRPSKAFGATIDALHPQRPDRAGADQRAQRAGRPRLVRARRHRPRHDAARREAGVVRSPRRRPGLPQRAGRARCTTAVSQVPGRLQTPLPQFNGQHAAVRPVRLHRPAVPRRPTRAHTALDGAGVTVAITDAYAAPTIALDADTLRRDARRRRLRPGPVHPGRARRPFNTPGPVRPGRLVRRGDPRRRGRARHGAGRQHPLLRRRELLRRRLPRHARTGRRRGHGVRSSPTPGATSRRPRRRRRSRPTSRSSCRARSRASASCSPRATTATSSPTPAPSRPTTRPPTRT